MKKFNRELADFINGVYEGEKKVLVFGDGNPRASLMMIGEAPGEQEALLGKPFVGKAGKNLDEFLLKSGFVRDELYITNTVKFRPVKLSKAGRYVNRAPNREEIELFLPWLKREIALVNPKVIVTLGNVPLKALLGKQATIGEIHGRFLEQEGRRYFPIYHPAAMIYNPSIKALYTEDLAALNEWKRRGEGEK